MVKTSTSDLQKSAYWNEEEDAKMAAFPSKQRGMGNWSTSLKRSGQRRGGKICREKWSSSSNQKPDPKPKMKIFTPQEEELVIQLHAAIGSRWPIIALQIPGKTESDVKILWNSKLKKRLSAMGIDPVTHKPFSQILADYGNMGATSRLNSLSRDLKPAFFFKQDLIQTEIVKSEVYSQLEVINLVTEASKQINNQNFAAIDECESSPSNQEASSFSWSDFFLEDAFAAAQQNEGRILQFGDDEALKVKGLVEEDVVNGGGGGEGEGGGGGGSGADATSFSSSSSFVEAMIGKQEEMCSQSQLPCFYEEPFYY